MLASVIPAIVSLTAFHVNSFLLSLQPFGVLDIGPFSRLKDRGSEKLVLFFNHKKKMLLFI